MNLYDYFHNLDASRIDIITKKPERGGRLEKRFYSTPKINRNNLEYFLDAIIKHVISKHLHDWFRNLHDKSPLGKLVLLVCAYFFSPPLCI